MLNPIMIKEQVIHYFESNPKLRNDLGLRENWQNEISLERIQKIINTAVKYKKALKALAKA